VPYGGAGGVTANDAFMLVWFEGGTAAGQKYGSLQNDSATAKFVIPAEGTVQSYAAFFAGPTSDPIRGTPFTFSQQNPPGILAIDAEPGSTLLVAEESGHVAIPVRRTLGTGGTVGFTVTTTNGTAAAGSDFTLPSPPTFSIPPDEDSVEVRIPILSPANTSEPNETFTVSIGSPTGGAGLGEVTSITVRIIDCVDNAAPAAPVIANPAAGSLKGVNTLAALDISGTATDGKGVGSVKVKLNGGNFVDAVVAAQGAASTGWVAAVTPVTGPNTITVQSFDMHGNASPTVVRSFTVTRPLEVIADASFGSVTTGFIPGPTYREVGKSYSITATPKAPSASSAGGIFAGWSLGGSDVDNDGDAFTPERLGVTAEALEKPAITFIFREGLKLTANFVENPYDASVVGTYNGLIKSSTTVPDRGTPGPSEEDGTAPSVGSEGGFTATVQNSGAFSGKITIDGQVHTVAGSFDAQGRARFGVARTETQIVPRANKPSLIVNLDIGGPEGSAAPVGKIVGQVSAAASPSSAIESASDIAADRAHFTGLTAALTVPDAYLTVSGSGTSPTGRTDGVFTVALPSVPLSAQPARVADALTEHDYAQGSGVGTIRVTKAGAVTLVATLADGTAVTATSTLSEDLRAGLFAQLYSAKGFISAPLKLDSARADSDLSAEAGSAVLWSRPFNGTSHYYPHGWAEVIEVSILGAKYAATSGESVLKMANETVLPPPDADGNAVLTFSNGLLSDALSKFANLSATDAVTKVPASDPSFTMTVNRLTGMVTGTFVHTNDSVCNYSAIILQKGPEAGAQGYFLTRQPVTIDFTGESGGVKLIGEP
jgi:hypothetical protein